MARPLLRKLHISVVALLVAFGFVVTGTSAAIQLHNHVVVTEDFSCIDAALGKKFTDAQLKDGMAKCHMAFSSPEEFGEPTMYSVRHWSGRWYEGLPHSERPLRFAESLFSWLPLAIYLGLAAWIRWLARVHDVASAR